jgi:hypothetical protein
MDRDVLLTVAEDFHLVLLAVVALPEGRLDLGERLVRPVHQQALGRVANADGGVAEQEAHVLFHLKGDGFVFDIQIDARRVGREDTHAVRHAVAVDEVAFLALRPAFRLELAGEPLLQQRFVGDGLLPAVERRKLLAPHDRDDAIPVADQLCAVPREQAFWLLPAHRLGARQVEQVGAEKFAGEEVSTQRFF